MDLQINGTVYKLTNHAKYRMEKRGVSIDDLVEALSNIKARRPQYKEGFEARVLLTGKNNVSAVTTISGVIVTVYNYKKQYYDSKNKSQFNKKRRQLKKVYGNRLKR